MRYLFVRLVLISSVVACAFLAGGAFERRRFWPYAQVAGAWRTLTSRPAAQATTQARQPQVDSGAYEYTKAIDSTLLPLRLHGFRLAARGPVSSFAGGLTQVGTRVLIVDRLGKGFSFEQGRLNPLELPQLPNRVEDFRRTPTIPERDFRVHDVEYLPDARLLAVSHEWYDATAKCSRLALSAIGFDAAAMRATGEWRTLWKGGLYREGARPGAAGGGRIAAAGPHHCYLTTIDYIPDDITPPFDGAAQNEASSFGKILKIDLQTGAAEMISRGHRNPQGLCLTASGELIATEHGPGGGDELNLIRPGANYGWPEVTLGTEYISHRWPRSKATGRHDGFTAPLFAWLPAIATSNLIELTGFHPAWDGDLLVASLKGSSLFRVRRDGARVLYVEPVWIGERIRDLVQLPDARIALWTDNANVLLLQVDVEKLRRDERAPAMFPAIMAACVSCHHFGPTNPLHPAPTLSGLLGKPIASDNFAQYSPALRAARGTWNRQNLRAFLADPPAFAPGTSMPKFDLSDADLDTIIEELHAHSGH